MRKQTGVLLSVLLAVAGCGDNANPSLSKSGASHAGVTEQRGLARMSAPVSEDGIEAKVYRLYQAAFDRQPDLEGLGYWIYQMQNGLTLEQTAWNFTNSDEFKLKFGSNVSNMEFVTLLYRNVLHRQPDPEGYAYWNRLLGQGTINREQALIEFSESIENKAGTRAAVVSGIRYVPVGWNRFTATSAPTVIDNGENTGSPVYAVADFDGDGLEDMALAMPAESSFFPDAATTAQPTPIRILQQNGSSLIDSTVKFFSNPFAMILPSQINAIKLNNDGRADLVVAAGGPDPYPQNGVAVTSLPPGDYARWATSTSGTFKTGQASNVDKRFLHNSCVGDLNGDGYDDAFMVSITEKSHFLLSDGGGNLLSDYSRVPAEILDIWRLSQNKSFHPDGHVKESTKNQFSACALVDVNDDKLLDLLVLGYGGQYHALYINDGRGNFAGSTRIEIPSTGLGFGLGLTTNNHVNNGVPATKWYSHGALSLNQVTTDINGDGRKDVIILMTEKDEARGVFYKGSRIQVLMNSGKGLVDETASRSMYTYVGDAFHSMGSYDVNGDGLLDLVVTRSSKQDFPLDSGPDTRFLINNGYGTFVDATDRISLPPGSYLPMTVNGKISLVRTRVYYKVKDPITGLSRSNLEVSVFTNGISAR